MFGCNVCVFFLLFVVVVGYVFWFVVGVLCIDVLCGFVSVGYVLVDFVDVVDCGVDGVDDLLCGVLIVGVFECVGVVDCFIWCVFGYGWFGIVDVWF